MPSPKLKLPPHVVAKGPRQDGTYNVMYRVRRDRPQDWPSSIPLPWTGKRTGDLNNADEVARIFADADTLAARLEAARQDLPAHTYPADSLPGVAAEWEKSWVSDELGARTQEFYRKSLRPLTDWSASERHKPLRSLALPAIIRFLRRYDDRPAQRAALRRTLSALFSFALIEGVGGVTTHPFGVVPRLKRRRGRKRKVETWTQADVDAYAASATARGWRGGALMLKLMWQTSADQTDVVTWRRDQHFRDGARPAITYARGKTGEAVTIPISASLAAELRACGEIYFVTDPHGRPYRKDDPRSDNQRGGHFRTLRDEAVASGARHLVLDHLRHSAVTDALEKGAKLEHIPSMTGHRGSEMVEQVYGQLTETQAAAVQRVRGFIE